MRILIATPHGGWTNQLFNSRGSGTGGGGGETKVNDGIDMTEDTFGALTS